jgi:hypothetical protein
VHQYLNTYSIYHLSRQRLTRNKLTNADDCETLVNEHGALTDVTPGPVGATMALFLGEGDKSRPVSSGIREVMDGKYATHFVCEKRCNLSTTYQGSQNFYGRDSLFVIR